MVSTLLAIGGLAALFVVFGAFHLARRPCDGCTCGGGSCERDEAEHSPPR